MKPKKTISINYDLDFSFDVDEIWPDGDAPDNPTEDDVWEVIRECGGVAKILADWDLDDCITEHDVSVSVSVGMRVCPKPPEPE